MIASELNTSHHGKTLRLPEDPKHKHRRFTIRQVGLVGDHMLLTVRDSFGRVLPLPLAPGATVEVTA